MSREVLRASWSSVVSAAVPVLSAAVRVSSVVVFRRSVVPVVPVLPEEPSPSPIWRLSHRPFSTLDTFIIAIVVDVLRAVPESPYRARIGHVSLHAPPDRLIQRNLLSQGQLVRLRV